MRLDQLKYFAEVARCHSIALASEKLFVTQPAISIAIKNLEEELNCTLFNRSKNDISLTEVGSQILQSAKKILEEENYIYQIAEQNQKSDEYVLTGNLKIGTTPILLYSFLKSVIMDLLEKNKQLSITVNESLSTRVLDDVLDGKCDIGISVLTEEDISRMLEIGQLKVRRLYSEKNYIIAHSDFGFSEKKSVSLEQVEKLPFVMLGVLEEEKLLKNHNIEKNIVLSTFNLELIEEIVCKGMAITMLPSSLLQNFSSKKEVDIIPIRDSELGSFCYFYKENHLKKELLLRVIDKLEKYCYSYSSKNRDTECIK